MGYNREIIFNISCMSAYTFEIWKDIEGYEGKYQISTFGRVKSMERKSRNRCGSYVRKEKILKPINHRQGYLKVNINRNKRDFIHRLVAKTFIPNPLNKEQVNHIDDNKSNNFINNLEWVTNGENVKKAYETGRIKKLCGELNPSATLTLDKVKIIRSKFKSGLKMKNIANEFNVSYSAINRIINNETWQTK